ncbi:aspartate carbamoyltransferase regulatory subunit [Clostridium putrefaciens]|uniref:Aspartate carbamoyltransferase regulatory subunit n=1 Tax=Clostridium putrefaciens TaxID=99675 RepID=A0A381J8J7_9CLOT|nr:aspartate carbamoyltransferase regulatory subunit [Clostridium putrefaciens]SUY47329.1 aspartate carbamoyltransferase regulatory subunit [Clostridium putrefaciens]
MVSINSIRKGIVIDHIKAGLGMKIFKYLGLDTANYTVALIMNAPSSKLNMKDMIKIENELDIDYTVLGILDASITIDIIEDEKIVKKLKLQLPLNVENIIKCKNPRCVTSVENYITQSFYLSDRENSEYRCAYCDEASNLEDI